MSTTYLLLLFGVILTTKASTEDDCIKIEACGETITAMKNIFKQKNLEEIYDKLDELKLIEDDLILFLNDKELDEIVSEWNLAKVEKIRFQALIRKIKHDKKIDAQCLIIEYGETHNKQDIDIHPQDMNKNIEEERIELIVHSYRGHLKQGHNGHPKCLLESNNSRYYSERYWSFNYDEHDWIIFKFKDDNKLYLPNKLDIRNWDSSDNNGVKTLSISIGDIVKNEWITFNPMEITLHNINKDSQIIEIDGIEAEIIRDKRYQYLRLLLKENHGGWWFISPKYVLIEVQVYGVEIVQGV